MHPKVGQKQKWSLKALLNYSSWTSLDFLKCLLSITKGFVRTCQKSGKIIFPFFFAIYQNVWLIVCILQNVVHAAKLQIISQKLGKAILYTFSHPRKYVCQTKSHCVFGLSFHKFQTKYVGNFLEWWYIIS